MSDDHAVAWLRQQVEGDRELAEWAALDGNGQWFAGSPTEPDDDSGEYVNGEDETVHGDRLWIYPEGGHTRLQAEHIARHDPQDVIADCEAKLALLDVHVPVEDDGRLTCKVCVTWEDDEGEHEFGIALPVTWPCTTLEIVAAGYRQRDGYAGCWDPQACPACGKPDVVLPLGHELAVPMDGSAPSCKILPPPDPGIIAEYLGEGRT